MSEQTLYNSSIYPSVRETIQKFNMHGKSDLYSSVVMKLRNKNLSLSTESTTMSDLQFDTQQKTSSFSLKSLEDNEHIESEAILMHSPPPTISEQIQIPANHSEDIGLEIIESLKMKESLHNKPSTIADYGVPDVQFLPSPRLPPLPPAVSTSSSQNGSMSSRKRTLPLTNFLLEIGALVIMCIICMILVLAIREEQANLRTTMQIVSTYIYLVSIIWMIWCTYDIIKFRKQWQKLTLEADNQSEYMYVVEHHVDKMAYFPNIHNSGGLFMRVGAGILCMGSLALTVIELAKIVEIMGLDDKSHISNYSSSVFVTKSISYILRFLFHCIQFMFLFRYGNIIIDRYHFIAKFGLIHIIIANLSTWFEAIVFETLEELHTHATHDISTTIHATHDISTTIHANLNTTISSITSTINHFFKAAPVEESSSENSTKTVLQFIEDLQSAVFVYLYPCLIEYSLICVTVFYIMWRNVGKRENRLLLHFGARHVFTINCSRASCGLLLGGIIFLLTILTLLPAYILELRLAIIITHSTEFVLLFVSVSIVFISFIYTTKLYYDDQAHVDIFDQILILITTVGNFAYAFFDMFASIFIESYTIDIPRSVEIIIGILAIFQTFLQSAFILDTLKRRVITKKEIRNKPGRELVTALLLINLAIWLHDSISAKKVKLNPLQGEYYNPETWSIVQAFTSPLSIFYRFHSSVCLADIWQEVYHDPEHDRTYSKRVDNHSNNQH